MVQFFLSFPSFQGENAACCPGTEEPDGIMKRVMRRK